MKNGIIYGIMVISIGCEVNEQAAETVSEDKKQSRRC